MFFAEMELMTAVTLMSDFSCFAVFDFFCEPTRRARSISLPPIMSVTLPSNEPFLLSSELRCVSISFNMSSMLYLSSLI